MTITEVKSKTEVDQFLNDLRYPDEEFFAAKYKELEVLDLNEALANRKELLFDLFNKLGRLTKLKKLDLSNNDISSQEIKSASKKIKNNQSSLTSSLSKLTELEEITITDNPIGAFKVVDAIAAGLTPLTKLKKVNISDTNSKHTGLKAKGVEMIVKALFNSKDTLQTLELWNNGISSLDSSRNQGVHGNSVKGLFEALGKLTKLQVLNLNYNQLGMAKLETSENKGVDFLAEALVNLKELRELHLYKNDIKEDSELLLDNLKKLAPTLKILQLGGNYIAGDRPADSEAHEKLERLGKPKGETRAKYLVETLKELKNLKQLSVTNNGLKGTQLAEVVCALIESKAPLEALNLSNNKAGDTGAFFICVLLNECLSLKTLIMQYNYINVEGIAELLKNLSSNETLEYLCLNFTTILRANTATKIADTLKANKNLKHLKISHSLVKDKKVIQIIADGLKQNKSLKHLGISHTDIGIEGAEYIAEALEGKELEYLNFQTTNIGTGDLTGLFNHLTKIKSLKKLDISTNKIKARLVGEIDLFLPFANVKQIEYMGGYDFESNDNINAINVHEEFNNLFENEEVNSLTKFFEFLLRNRKYLKNTFVKEALLKPSLWENECDEMPKFFVKELLFREAIKEFDKKIDLVKERLSVNINLRRQIEKDLNKIEQLLNQDDLPITILKKMLEFVFNKSNSNLLFDFTKKKSLHDSIVELDKKIKPFLSRNFSSLEAIEEAKKLLNEKIELVKELLSEDLPKVKIIKEAAKLLDHAHKMAIISHSYASYFNNQNAKQMLENQGILTPEKKEQAQQIENILKNKFVVLKHFHEFNKTIEVKDKPLSIEFYVLSQLMSEENLKFVESLNTGFDEETGICNNEDFVANTLKNQLVHQVFCDNFRFSKAPEQKKKETQLQELRKKAFEKIDPEWIDDKISSALMHIKMAPKETKEIQNNSTGTKRPAATDITSAENNLKRQKLNEAWDSSKQEQDFDDIVDNNYQTQIKIGGDTKMLVEDCDDQIPQ